MNHRVKVAMHIEIIAAKYSNCKICGLVELLTEW